MITTMFQLIELAKQFNPGMMSPEHMTQMAWQFMGIAFMAVTFMMTVTTGASLAIAKTNKR